MQLSKHWKTGAIAAAALLALLVGATPAQADPATGTNPTLDGYGSDTTQDVMNAVSMSVNRDHADLMGSYDAGTVGMIASGETSTVSVPRANGSGQGRTMLLAAIDGTPVTLNGQTSTGAVTRDIAEFGRSSSAGKWSDTGRLAYIPFGIDGVSYAAAGISVVPRNLPLGSASDPTDKLTLRNIYMGNVTTVTDRKGQTHTLTPLLPQSGSGTRAFWLQSLNITDAQVGANVKSVDAAGASIQENTGVHIQRPTDLVPYSIGQYSAQARYRYLNQAYPGFKMEDRRHGAYLGYIDGVAPQNNVRTAANLDFPVLRPVYNVVEYDAITPGTPVYNAQLAAAFVGPNSYVITAKSATGTSTISDFGFAEIPVTGWDYADFVYTPGMIRRAS